MLPCGFSLENDSCDQAVRGAGRCAISDSAQMLQSSDVTVVLGTRHIFSSAQANRLGDVRKGIRSFS